MHRVALNISRRVAQAPLIPTVLSTPRATGRSSLHSRTYATSSPKEAEQASAQSGGSRSKDAAKGRTGGGEPLSSSENPPPQPKIQYVQRPYTSHAPEQLHCHMLRDSSLTDTWNSNASVPGTGKDKLTKEQQEEVDRHNADFDKKHDRANPAADDKVDKGFWSGHAGENKR